MRLLFPALLLAWPVATGCTGHLNPMDAPLGDPLPDLVGVTPDPGSGARRPDEDASLPRSGDRSGWAPTVVRVERRQVESQPAYVSMVGYDDTTARERGDYPTTASVLEGPGDGGMAAWEGLAAPFYAAWDLVISPVRMFFEPPGTTLRRPANPPSLLATPEQQGASGEASGTR